ncbi:MAG: EAL domain-containing protein [Gammaproteobacteria bacterium]
MKKDSHTPVALGFMTILVLLFSLVFTALVQLQITNKRMEELVEATFVKTAAANDMRDAIRLRSGSLKSMMLSRDNFERDEEYQRFTNYAEKFRVARERFASPGMGKHEAALIEQLNQLTGASQPHADNAASLLMNSTQTAEIDEALKMVAGYQEQIHAGIGKLVALEGSNTAQALENNRNHYLRTRQLLFTLTGIALLFTLMVARAVISRASKMSRQIAHQATHDNLTGLINRYEFECRVERAIENARAQDAAHALLYMDLDQFKTINDSCGQLAGDELLRQLSRLLLGSIRQRDTLGRLGGDEFGMLLENCPLENAVRIANNLLTTINNFKFSWGENSFTPGISIGIVPIDQSSTSLASVMNAADSACYIAKKSGRDQVQIAHLGDQRLQQRHGEMQWVSRLSKALEEDRFTLYFQPILPCAGHHGVDKHIEILLRLIDEDGTVITPTCFLPASEKFNMATSIDRWVISHAMEWQANDPAHGDWPVIISINLSMQSIGNPEMLKFIINELEKTGADPGRIIFEVTETAAIANISSTSGFMLTLRGCGFRFSLDDFGSSLSSFNYLKKLPVDFLKIDGSFVRDILSDPVDHAMVKAINELGHLLGKQTIAEYVETRELADELLNMGVDFAQGYVYARPQPLTCFSQAMGPHLVVVASRQPS